MPILQQFMMYVKTQEAAEFIESMILCFAAPVLSGIKCANLLNISRKDASVGATWLEIKEALGNRLDLDFFDISVTEHSALVLVYRNDALKAALSRKPVRDFLIEMGYDADFTTIESHLERLANAYRSRMPHEIGLFLDYPLDDVKSFIEHGGQNAKFSGYWKVYGDEINALQKFGRYRKAETMNAYLLLEKAGMLSRAA